MRTHPGVRTLLSVAALAVLVCAWLVLAPVGAGGAASYVIVDGDSMLPNYAKGDLVIIRRVDVYAVGEVVAYEHRDLGPVVHRIVGLDGPRFVLRGDANTWLDTHRPTSAEVLGRAWVHLPAVGTLIEKLRSGPYLVVLSIIMGVLIVSLFATDHGDGRSAARPPTRSGAAPRSARHQHRSVQSVRQGLAAALAAVLLASLVLGLVAFTRPATVSAPHRADHTHAGTFGYSAEAPVGLYDTDRVHTGQPVFRRVTDTLTLRFDYRLAAKRTMDAVRGEYRLNVRISDPTNGWSRTVSLRPETPFEQGRFSTTATLDLNEVQQIIASVEERSGLRTDRYALTFAPLVTVRSVVGGQPLQESFNPRLDFWLDDLLLQLQTPTGVAGSEAPFLHPTQAGGATDLTSQPNTVPLLGLDLPVSTGRLLAVFGALLSVAGLLFAYRPLIGALRGDAADRIRVRYGHLLVTIDRPPAAERAAVQVNTIGDLVKLANATGRNVLYRRHQDGDEYYVHDDAALYRYQVHHRDDRSPVTPLAKPRPVTAQLRPPVRRGA